MAQERLEVRLGDAADGVDVCAGAVVLGHVAPEERREDILVVAFEWWYTTCVKERVNIYA